MVYTELLQPPYVYYLIAGALALWLAVLTFILLKYIFHYNRMIKVDGRKNLKSILNEILRTVGQNQKDLLELEKKLKKLDKNQAKFLQKVGFLRFNPFSDTGGDQSFILAILNGKGDGMILSSLHSRGMTRLYAKEVDNGKSNTFKLSKEEEQVVKKLVK